MNILIHMWIAMSIWVSSVAVLAMNDVRFPEVSDNFNALLIVFAAVIPACIFLRYIPTRCSKCGHFTLFNADFLNYPRWAPQSYKCRYCGYDCYQFKGKIHSKNDT